MSRILTRLALVVLAILPVAAQADYWEFSSGASYTRSKYPGGSYSWSRKFGGSIGYNFTDSSTVEFGYQKSRERNHYEGFEDSFYDDQVYSVNWVQNLLSKQAVIQPYFKLGVGQLIRKASIYDNLGRSQIQSLSQITGVAGGGFRIYLTKTFAIRLEGTSYLAKGKLNTWKDNFGMTFGASIYF
jgi:hypothetical protein